MPSTPLRGAAPSVRTVYGALLNDRATLERMGPRLAEPPYRQPPQAPVLYIKPRNTFAVDGSEIEVPADPGRVRIDATLGAVIGRRATRVDEAQALDHIAGFRIVSDLTLPHDNVHRPAVRLRGRDGFCPMSACLGDGRLDLAQTGLEVLVNERVVFRRRFDQLVRPLPRLLADVSAFMSLEVGDVLLLGPPEGAPLAGPGDAVRLTVAGLGSLSHRLVAEALPARAHPLQTVR